MLHIPTIMPRKVRLIDQSGKSACVRTSIKCPIIKPNIIGVNKAKAMSDI